MARYGIEPARSRVSIHARSSLHPIHTEADGLDGWLEMTLSDGDVDSLSGHIEFPVEKLTSGKDLEDKELRRRIDSRRFPTISGDIETIKPTDTPGRYLVAGALTFRGVTRRYEDEVTVVVTDGSTVSVEGQSVFDIRDFGMEPPRILMLKVEPQVTVRIDVVATPVSNGKG